MKLLQHLSTLITVSSELETALEKGTSERILNKHEVLLQAGQRCSELFYVESGTIRGFHDEDAKEVTNWFAGMTEFATCFYAFIGQHSSSETIQTLEATQVTIIPYSVLRDLYRNFPETERVGRMITEAYYMKLEERLRNIRFKTAKERYHNLIESRPDLIQKASLGQIASYLGITQETLSRIRAEL